MKIGTKSVLFGAHIFWLHPFFVAWRWWKLYGFPWDPRLWVAFFVHDLGYWGKPNMDGEEGERHPEWAAQVMFKWFEAYHPAVQPSHSAHYLTHGGSLWRGTAFRTLPAKGKWQLRLSRLLNWVFGDRGTLYWHDLVLYHSRFYAKADHESPSRLCFADKMAICLTPWWVYRWTAGLTGEIREYRKDAANPSEGWANKQDCSDRKWYLDMQEYIREWVEKFKDGSEDTWTKSERTARTESGVWE